MSLNLPNGYNEVEYWENKLNQLKRRPVQEIGVPKFSESMDLLGLAVGGLVIGGTSCKGVILQWIVGKES